MILIRYILYALVIYLIVRLFAGQAVNKQTNSGKVDLEKDSAKSNKKVSKEIGEYVDYEDLKK
jgi:hypothetical protein